MDSKQKAKDLVDRFINYAISIGVEEDDIDIKDAKQCALICVDEMQKKLVSIDKYLEVKTYSEYLKEFMELQEVKQQIELLKQ